MYAAPSLGGRMEQYLCVNQQDGSTCHSKNADFFEIHLVLVIYCYGRVMNSQYFY